MARLPLLEGASGPDPDGVALGVEKSWPWPQALQTQL